MTTITQNLTEENLISFGFQKVFNQKHCTKYSFRLKINEEWSVSVVSPEEAEIEGILIDIFQEFWEGEERIFNDLIYTPGGIKDTGHLVDVLRVLYGIILTNE